jgi:hypothetical protein
MNAAELAELNESEKRHFYQCRCGEMVDKRQLDDVLFHETDHKPRPGYSIRRLGQNKIAISEVNDCSRMPSISRSALQGRST